MAGRRRPPPRGARHALFVLAHQDDECIVSTRIARELAWGHDVTCVFMTDGAGRGADPAVRDRESRTVLTSLGVAPDRQLFLGSRDRIPDTQLVLHLDRAWRALLDAVGDVPVTRIYCLAYEGGHQDHDAAHALAVALARRLGLRHRTWQVPFYHGWRTPWMLFRVHRPLPWMRRRVVRRLPAAEAVRHAGLCRGFPSQRLTWLGLFPELVVQRVLLRRETMACVTGSAVRERPHAGRLLYERMQGFSYDVFRPALDRFLDAHDV